MLYGIAAKVIYQLLIRLPVPRAILDDALSRLRVDAVRHEAGLTEMMKHTGAPG